MGGTRRSRVAVAVLCLVLVTALVPTVAADPTLDVTIDGTGVQGGETITVTDDPWVEIDASADTSIESVVIEVDGETRRSFEPGSETFSERVTLDLTDGEHEVSVVVEASDTRRVTATVRKDSTGPLVTYTSPFESDGYPSGGDVTIGSADTTLAADFRDQSAISSVRIQRDYTWTFAGSSNRDQTVYRIDDPGTNVSRPLLFGLGENTLEVVVIDEHGNRRTHDMTVTVEDYQRPTITLDRFDRTADGRIEVAGSVSDNVKVNSLEYRIESTGDNQYAVNPTSKEPTRERVETEFEFTATINEDTESVTLVATDVAGNIRAWEVPLDYRGHLVPTITIDETATRVDGDAVAVEGSVVDGRVTRVVVESRGPDGTIVDTVTVHDGEPTDEVIVRKRVAAADGETTVVIRAIDADGGEYGESLTIETPTITTTADADAATATATPVATETPTTGVVAEGDSAVPATETATQAGQESGGDGGDGGASIPWPKPRHLFVVGGIVLVVIGVQRVDWRQVSLPTPWRRIDWRRGSLPTPWRRIDWRRGSLPTPWRRIDWRRLPPSLSVPDSWGDDSSQGSGVDNETAGTTRNPLDGYAELDDDARSRAVAAVDDRDTIETLVAALDREDIKAVAEDLDADDEARVAMSIRVLTDVAVTRPELLSGVDLRTTLHDLSRSENGRLRRTAVEALTRLDE